jgi:hypothetical protein
MEGHHPIDPILWDPASILEDSKLSGVLGGWVVRIYKKLQLDPIRLVCVSPINLVHLLRLGNKREGGGSCAQKEANQRRIWKTYSLPLSGLKFFKRGVIIVLYVERTIAISDLF